MGTILKIVVISLIVAFFTGWLLNLIIIFFLNIFRKKRLAEFPTIKRQIIYALPTAFVLFVTGWLLFLANVEMH
ncbi:MAG: hypothetical protein ACR2NC_01005 [Thermodesulfobacteriota bacterium]